MKKISAIVEVCLVALVIGWILCGCAPRKYAYKVTFTDGTVEYYELNYKVKAGAKAIEYDDETILGIETIEKLK